MCLGFAVLGTVYLLWSALLETICLLWHLPWHELATSSFTTALASLLAQACLANCSDFYVHLLLWPAAWILICLPWSSYTAQWAVWVCVLSAAFDLKPMLSGMFVHSRLAYAWRFFQYVTLWLTAWMLMCCPCSLHPGQWAAWVFSLITAFVVCPTLLWLRDQKHDKLVPQSKKSIDLWQIKGLSLIHI